jgi:uncharacterized protein
MIKKLELKLTPSESSDEKIILKKIRSLLKLKPSDKLELKFLRRSIDARGKTPFINLLAEAYINEILPSEPSVIKKYINVRNKTEVIIIGAGPAGYFAAMELIENGIKPVIFDRGKDVRSRRKDLRAIQQFGIVNPDSNYCFGEGGAGTYSDGKLYTRSHKRGDINKALKILVEHGADPDILVDAHPHIGSNKLPKVVQNIRGTIMNYGGEIHFDSRITDLIIKNNKASGVIINEKEERISNAVILATGHSARDIFYLLNSKKVMIEYKPFAMGIRIEHPQALIDSIQFKQSPRDVNLPAASYKLVSQVLERGVFSFCMCPGGLIVPSATSPGELVVNGMSLSRRDSPFANSGIVVQIEELDLINYKSAGVFRGLEYQKEYEQKFFDAGDGSQKAPAQRMTDFVDGKSSSSLGKTSYIPGIYSHDLNELLPENISGRLKEGLISFGKKMKGYFTEEGIMIGIESRTSSPIRIPRDKSSLMHIEIENLYPCGEGAGYAGGIISAALDGQNVANAIAKKINL